MPPRNYQTLAPLLDLKLALQRVRREMSFGRAFYGHPFELRLVEMDEERWLHELSASIAAGEYAPGELQICDVPKPGGHFRPGGWLSLQDHVYYTALVGACYPNILRAISDIRDPLDFSYRLNRKTTSSEWILNPFVGWERFRRASLERIQSGAAFVLNTDLAGYYETISHHRLIADLRQHGVCAELCAALSGCLTRWSPMKGRGIPQGFSASDILGKLYLSEVDLVFAEMGYSHYRYVDDFRVFCQSQSEARRGLMDLTRLLRERGLIFQTSKSSILAAPEAIELIDGIARRIRAITEEYLAETAVATGLSEGYMTLQEADAALPVVDDAPIEVLERAYMEDLLSGEQKFNKTMFHFLIKRLGKGQSRLALEHSVALLTDRPEETRHCTLYWDLLGLTDELDGAIAEFVASPAAVSAYQVHQLFEWRAKAEAAPTSGLLEQIRRYCFAPSSAFFLRTTARRCLARFGSRGDLARIRRQYSSASSALEKAEIMCCVARLEPATRNEFYRTVARDGDYQLRAERAVKQGLVALNGQGHR